MRSLQSTVADVRAWVESTETGAWLLAQMEGIAAALRSFEEAVVPLPLWVFALLAAVALFGLAGMVRARRRRHAAVRRNAISPYEVLSAYGAPPADANPSDMPPSDSARAAIVAGWITLLLFFGGFGTWAATAPLNGAVMGEAVLKVEGNRKSVQHLDGGIVSEIKVREGDRVNAGEILMLLNDSQARAEYDVLVQQHATLRTTEARLLAEFNASPDIVFPQDLLDSGEAYVRTAIDGQRDEFRSRRQAIEGKQVVLRQRAAQLYEQNIGNEARLKAQRSQLVSVEAELETMVDLLERGLVTRPRVLQLERAATSLEADIAGTQASIASSQQALAEISEQIAQFQKEFTAEVTAALREVRSRLNDVEPRLRNATGSLERNAIRAPYSGTVIELGVFSTGAVVRPGEHILNIVPDETSLIVEARIAVEDIADVRPGMNAEIHFTSYKQRVTPLIGGVVVDVSPDRLTDDRTGAAYYLAVVEADTQALAERPEIELYPGMPATVMITTEERTALDYLIGPLSTSFNSAFRQK
jgi:membrane fusion protein, epimerase transport system